MKEKKPFFTKKELLAFLITTVLLVAILVPSVLAVTDKLHRNQRTHEMRIAMNAYMDAHQQYLAGTTLYYFDNGITDGTVYTCTYENRALTLIRKTAVTAVNTEEKTFILDGSTLTYDITNNPHVLIVLPTE